MFALAGALGVPTAGSGVEDEESGAAPAVAPALVELLPAPFDPLADPPFDPPADPLADPPWPATDCDVVDAFSDALIVEATVARTTAGS